MLHKTHSLARRKRGGIHLPSGVPSLDHAFGWIPPNIIFFMQRTLHVFVSSFFLQCIIFLSSHAFFFCLSLSLSHSSPTFHTSNPTQQKNKQDRRNKYEKGVNRKIAEQQARENGMYGDDEPGPGASAYVSDDDEYTAAAATRDAKRAAKEEKYRRQAGIIAAPEEEMDDDEKREIGNKIMANRGLTPHRNKDHKNPRKRLRGKFEKAVVRRKGQVRAMREDGGGYGGEASGIKTTVTKSRRFGA